MAPVKRSITISGHRTSLSLEPEFWAALKQIAAEGQGSAAQLIGRIDKQRGRNNLSSAVRVYVLAHYQGRHIGRGGN